MKLSDLMAYGKSSLEKADKESPLFDSMCILEQASGLNKTNIYLNADKDIDKSVECCFKANIHRRAKGEPLQYILESWDFMGMNFLVGPGVLIPRPETEILVELAVSKIRQRKEETVVFDLCAGTGCIGISVAKLCANANVYLVEKSPEALEYLTKNNNCFQLENTTIIQGDIFEGFHAFKLPQPDIVLSNPPYIPTEEIESLQTEVTFEPREALDGGCNGLDFYRAINELWSPYMNTQGMLAVECGESQATKISELFSNVNNRVSTVSDYNKIKRVVLMENGR
ncbi:MAG: peptide chain release factor N(5)-glutamine methyltransferase [Clostridiales bacterium]|nr:peptide chain release factor N(5)-glutamine methyltransferase [Clostridiales bacterium]